MTSFVQSPRQLFVRITGIAALCQPARRPGAWRVSSSCSRGHTAVPRRSDGPPRHGSRTPGSPGKCIFIVITLPSRGIWWKWRSEDPAEVRTGTGSIITCSLILCVALSNSVSGYIQFTIPPAFITNRDQRLDWIPLPELLCRSLEIQRHGELLTRAGGRWCHWLESN